MRVLGMLAAAAFLLSACASSTAGATPSATPPTSAAPSANPADSKAADLRTQLDLLLAEHVMLVAKQATAATNHSDEYTGYATLLGTNANAIVDLMRSAFGNNSASGFQQAWANQNADLVEYTIGLVSHNATKSNGAMSGLVNGFEPQFVAFIAGLTQLPSSQLSSLVAQHVTLVKTVIDDEMADSYTQLFSDLRSAYMQSSQIGDMLATRMVQEFPDKFPGDASSSAVGNRVLLNMLLDENSYLATMTSDAAAGGRTAEQVAGTASLAANVSALGKLFTNLIDAAAGPQVVQAWGARSSALIAYATKGDAASRQALTNMFLTRFSSIAPAAADAARNQLDAMIKVIDDQRAKRLQQVAADDRAAAAAMQPLADRID